GRDALELFGVSRICERRGDLRARDLYERSIAHSLPEDADRKARRSLALLAKRAGDLGRAEELWCEMLGSSREGIEAYEQLAIYYERSARDYRKAAELTREALAALRKANRLGIIERATYGRHKVRFHRRLTRIERKLSRTQLDSTCAESQRVLIESKATEPGGNSHAQSG
ncbi:MAG: hypothetical protein KGL75_06200, partial [Acidobacteriota bacterium]|nr:hypothetical protein [Acidobacteriota bacterium]